ncbi:conserved hypothetical protein [Coccidioides posadasii str. Silveira]|uniref:Uncharacterized protein n=2 Tax=Coccidioides posadasii TaxID=199306 RepID=E9DBC7_COCPS|nr:conserved hypothetical protein [Coccidioides posadasii str. Silveira]
MIAWPLSFANMEARSDQFNFHSSSGHSISSTHPPQLWMNHPFSLSSGSHARRFDHSLNEPTLAQRTAAFRQLNRLPQRAQRIRRQTTSIGSRSSFPSQPVVVKTYSAETDARSTMSRHISRSERHPPAKLPPVQEFGIEGILRAIEPDIRNTLEAIAEICGRSKLSLANEYGSHRPPLGEIRAPTRPMNHGLLAVEEATSSSERLADENIIVVGDDISTVDGREQYSSRYGFFESMQANIGALDYRFPFPPWNESDPQVAIPRRNPTPAGESRAQSQAHECQPKLRPSLFPWALLGRSGDFGNRAGRQSIQSRPVISEVHLDAQASSTDQQLDEMDLPIQLESRHTSETERGNPMLKYAAHRLSFLSDLRGLLNRFKNVRQQNRLSDNEACVSAERNLRELLQRQNTYLLARDEHHQVLHVEAA